MTPKEMAEYVTRVAYVMATCADCGEQADSASDSKLAFASKLINEDWTVHCYRLLCPKCKRPDTSNHTVLDK
jgi:hypothetical protein